MSHRLAPVPLRRALAALGAPWVPLLLCLAALQRSGPALAAPLPPPPQPAGPQAATPLQPQPGSPSRSAGASVDPGQPRPYTPAEFADLLKRGTLEQLQEGCGRVIADDRLDRLRQIRDRLLVIHPAPQPLPVVLANASVLIACHQPQAALTVLDRFSPAAGAERVQWLLLEWRAAHAALDHRRAAIALERLTAMAPDRLEGLNLPLAETADGQVISRPALDLLAEHLQARGFPQAAAELLLASRLSGAAGARRRLEAMALLGSLPAVQREAILDSALDQAAAAGAWGLVAEILDAQISLPSSRALERRLRLSPRIDDAYGEWLIRRRDPAAAARTAALERELRAPRESGGQLSRPGQAPVAPPPTATPPTPSLSPSKP